jgi:hypothetical protein
MTTMKDLPVKLTEHEKLLKGAELVAAMHEIDQLEEQKKREGKVLADAIKAKDEHARELARTLRTGTEDRKVECTESKRFQDRMVDTIRMDTFQIISSRPMNPSELQEELDLQRHMERNKPKPTGGNGNCHSADAPEANNGATVSTLAGRRAKKKDAGDTQEGSP